MTKMEERYEGNYLDALDLPEEKLVPVVIESVAEPFSEKDSSGKPIKNAIISFKGKSKRLIINTTNFKNLKAMFGRNPNDWLGKTVSIQRRYLDAQHAFGIQNTLCIRIVPPVGTPILRSAANFMGKATPYGDVPKPQQSKQNKPKTQDNGLPGDVQGWVEGFTCFHTRELCEEWRRDWLPKCPDGIRAAVEQKLNEHIAGLKE